MVKFLGKNKTSAGKVFFVFFFKFLHLYFIIYKYEHIITNLQFSAGKVSTRSRAANRGGSRISGKQVHIYQGS